MRQQGGTLGFFLLQDGVLFTRFGRDFIEFLFGVLYFGLVFLDGCQVGAQRFNQGRLRTRDITCLLYTSDAADE